MYNIYIYTNIHLYQNQSNRFTDSFKPASRFHLVNHDAIRPVPAPTSTIRLKRGSRRHLASPNGQPVGPWKDSGPHPFSFDVFFPPGMDLEQHGSSHPWVQDNQQKSQKKPKKKRFPRETAKMAKPSDSKVPWGLKPVTRGGNTRSRPRKNQDDKLLQKIYLKIAIREMIVGVKSIITSYIDILHMLKLPWFLTFNVEQKSNAH